MIASEEVSTDRLTQKPCPPPRREQRRQQFAIVLLRDRLLHERDAAFVEQRPVGVDRIDHGEAGAIVT